MSYLDMGAAPPKGRVSTNQPAPGAIKGSVTVKKRTVTLNERGVQPSVWAQWNRDFARLIAPVAPAIRASALNAHDKAALISAPLDFIMDIFDPIEDAVTAAVTDWRRKTGKTKQNFFGKLVDIRIADHPDDAMLDNSTKNLQRRLRTVVAFIVLLLADPVNFIPMLAQRGLDVAGAIATEAVKSGGNALKELEDAASDVLDFLNPFNGLGALGLDDAAAAVAAALEAILAGDITVTSVLTLIGAIGAAATATSAAVGGAAVTVSAVTGKPLFGQVKDPPQIVVTTASGTTAPTSGSTSPGVKDLDASRLGGALGSLGSKTLLLAGAGAVGLGLLWLATRPRARSNPRPARARRKKRSR